MDNGLQSVLKKLHKEFGGSATEFHGEVSVYLPAEKILEACRMVKDAGFELLSALTAVDYWPQGAASADAQEPRFHVIYQFTSLRAHLELRLRVGVAGINPLLPSLTSLYDGANWRERELWDMFGIKFEGHPDLRRILMPADWEGHPLRKDYPLGYEEPQFTLNYEEILSRKPHPEM